MYHIGIVLHVVGSGKGVVSADDSVQAVVRMWDSNLLILAVDGKIGGKVKKNDYVLADYTPLTPESGNRRMVIVKVLPETEGSKIWAEFSDEYGKRTMQQLH